MDLTLLARHAQRIAGGLDDSDLARIDVHLYRAQPDFEALSQVEASYVPGAPPPEVTPHSWLGFVFSKPSVERERVQVHVLHAELAGGDELWLKLKRAEELERVAPAQPGAAIARFLRPGSYGLDLEVASGPAWLRTPISDDAARRMPVTYTPLDAPPRFRGLLYVKVPR